jgi:parallel beta-helix repeat protein
MEFNVARGIYVSSSSGDIIGNSISNSPLGVKLFSSPGIINVEANNIISCTTAVDADPTSVVINANIIQDCTYGIKVLDSFALITNNIITGCTYGVYIYNSDPVITDNTFVDNVYGIFVADDSDPTINDNTFINNTYNIYFIIWPTDIDPDTLNLKSQGKWISCYLEPTGNVDLTTVDISTVQISDIGGVPVMIPAESHPTAIGDEDIEITVVGELSDGTPFEGYCTIRVIEPGK